MIRHERLVVPLCLALAAVVCVLEFNASRRRPTLMHQPGKPTPPSDIQRMISDPKVVEGMKIFQKMHEHAPTTTQATARP